MWPGGNLFVDAGLSENTGKYREIWGNMIIILGNEYAVCTIFGQNHHNIVNIEYRISYIVYSIHLHYLHLFTPCGQHIVFLHTSYIWSGKTTCKFAASSRVSSHYAQQYIAHFGIAYELIHMPWNGGNKYAYGVIYLQIRNTPTPK